MKIAHRLGLMVLFAMPGFAVAQAPANMPVPKKITAPVEKAEVVLNAAPAGTPAEDWNDSGSGRVVRNVTTSTLLPFLPKGGDTHRAAVIVAPGGGYFMLSIDSEGYRVAQWLADHGVPAFLLKYRLTSTPADPAEFRNSAVRARNDATPPASPAAPRPEPRAYGPAVADAEAAVKLVRSNAAKWGVDAGRVGLIGFSAGAMSTWALAQSESKASRPDFIGLIYGPMSQQQVSKDVPPMFAAMAMDDPLFSRSGWALASAYRDAAVPVELHLYEHGGHGFGMDKKGTTSDLWIEQFYAWMKARGYLMRSAPAEKAGR